MVSQLGKDKPKQEKECNHKESYQVSIKQGIVRIQVWEYVRAGLNSSTGPQIKFENANHDYKVLLQHLMEAASKEAWRANSRMFRAASLLLDQATGQEVSIDGFSVLFCRGYVFVYKAAGRCCYSCMRRRI